jgi:hypothetical protein
MPHFGLMNEKALGPVEGPLQRSRLHFRCGRRRLREGKIAAGIVTLYDALEGAMQGYAASPEHRLGLDIREGEKMNDDRTLFSVLARSGVVEKSFDFDAFDRLLETALHHEMPDYDYRDLLKGVETLMTQLGALPFDDARLPPEDPSTF